MIGSASAFDLSLWLVPAAFYIFDNISLLGDYEFLVAETATGKCTYRFANIRFQVLGKTLYIGPILGQTGPSRVSAVPWGRGNSCKLFVRAWTLVDNRRGTPASIDIRLHVPHRRPTWFICPLVSKSQEDRRNETSFGSIILRIPHLSWLSAKHLQTVVPSIRTSPGRRCAVSQGVRRSRCIRQPQHRRRLKARGIGASGCRRPRKW